MSKIKNMVIDQMNEQKRESDFAQAINDLQGVSLEALEALHTAAHEVINQLKGDGKLTEAVARYPVLGTILTVELTTFKAYAVKYTKAHQNKQ